MAVFSEEDLQVVERRTALFDQLAAEFGCEIGKVRQLHVSVKICFHFTNIDPQDAVCLQKVSCLERHEKGFKDRCLTYGEIEFNSFCLVFKWIQKTQKDKDPQCWHNAFNNPGGTFVDLGHGTGKGILCGTIMHQFERCWGIELLESL